MRDKLSPLFFLAAAQIIGLLTAYFFGLTLKAILLISLSSILALFLLKFLNARIDFCLPILIFLILGMISMSLQLSRVTGGLLVGFAKAAERIELTGRILSVPKTTGERSSFEVQVETVKAAESLFRDFERTSVKLEGRAVGLRAGQLVRIVGKPSLVKSRAKESFNYRDYLLKRGIATVFYLTPNDISVAVKAQGFFGSLKGRLTENLKASLGGEEAAVLSAFLFGERSYLSKSVTEAFSGSGVAHVLVVSGLHVAIVGSFFLLIFAKLRASIKNALAILGVIFYALLIGPEPSLVRSTIMLTMGYLGWFLGREKDSISAISFSSILILACSPLSLFSVAFQLSFLATLGIILLSSTFEEIFATGFIWLDKSLAVTMAAQSLVIPLLFKYFPKFYLASPLANLVIAPLSVPMLYLGLISSVLFFMHPALALPLQKANALLAHLMLSLARWFASISAMSISTYTFPIWAISLYYLALFTFLSQIKKRGLKLGLKRLIAISMAAMTIALFVQIASIGVGSKGASVTFLDVGQGDSALILGEDGESVLIDGGASYEAIAGDLRRAGVKKIDLLLFSHYHDDHIGGLFGLIDDYKVGLLLHPAAKGDFSKLSLIEHIEAERIEYREARPGQKILLGREISIEVISAGLLNWESQNRNNDSMVVKVKLKGVSVLFVGDLEDEGQADLVRSGADLKCDIYKVSHHGSENGSLKEFLEAVRPKAAVISVGKGNGFGHPHQEAIEELESLGIDIYRTDEDGDITVWPMGRSIRVEKEH